MDEEQLLPEEDRTLFLMPDNLEELIRADASAKALEETEQQHLEDEGLDQGVMMIGGDPRTAYGSKTIGSWSSYVFIVNQIFGPGVLALPIVFQEGINIFPSLGPPFPP